MTKRDLKKHLPWLALLAVVPACADDGTSVTTDADTDESSSSSSSDTISPTTADSSDSSSSSTMSSADTSSTGTDPTDTDATETTDTDPTTGGAVCGDDTVEGREVCDGDDLGDETCESQGFGSGRLACADDCSAFDTSACVAAPVCGNDMLEDGEDCDGDELNDETCVTQNFDAGDLGCADDCTFDVSACVNFSCGDGSINGKEECDGDQLPDDVDCVSLGFGAGSISCTDNCIIDATGCCGDGNVGGGEVCEADDLGGETCSSVGNFDGGTLGCAPSCDGYDTSACTLCGDGEAEGDEICDGADLQGADCTTVPGGFVGGALACDAGCGYDTSGCNFCGNDMIDVGEECDGAQLADNDCLDLGFTGGSLSCLACGFDESACTAIPRPGAGEVVITEIMQNPAAIDDSTGEWFEVFNPGIESFQLRGCVVEGGGMAESFSIDTDLVIDGGTYLTFATDIAPGFTPDYAWPGAFSLNNATDTVRIVCDATIVDEVTYNDGATFPDPTGATMQLEPTLTDALANDDGTNWCEGAVIYGSGDFGTPGAANTSCLPPEYTVDFCRLQFPTSILDIGGAQVDVFGRIFIAGLTDVTGVNDPAVNVQMQVGYGPDGSDPAVDLTWVWSNNGAPNASYGPASPGYEGNNDEYLASMTLPAPGAYDFAVRFTGNGGDSYTYCDGDSEGSSDGYAPADAGQMTSLPSGDPSGIYFSEYYEGTGNNKGLEIYNPDDDQVNLGLCEVRLYRNGGVVSDVTNPLVGLIDPGGVFLLCDNSLILGQCDQTVNTLDFNGDDALELACDTDLDPLTPMATIDVIGQIGFDPGTAWGVPATADTENSAMRRNCAVTQGDSNGADAFDPAIEWTDVEVTVALQNLDDLGIYNCP
jgi:hypothetical protein